MCAVMNQVSDVNLALAVHEAAAMPSLMVTGDNRTDKINIALSEFVKCTGRANIVLHLDYSDLINVEIMKLIKHYKVSHVELLGALDTNGITTQQEFEHVMSSPLYRNGLKFLQSTTKTIIRILTATNKESNVNAYALKGSDSAGFTGKLSVLDLFNQQLRLTPGMSLIPYGGIGTPKQVADYINQGAAAVAVGTLFAASKESCLDNSVKQKMISADTTSLTKFSTSQQALVLGEPNQVAADLTPNRQTSLEAGIAGQGGLIYAGTAIDYVTEIRSVKDIVEYLVEDLPHA
jgi:NAD(P)H-dependent flavin oxidoreductase YrpB (nitropropane dioxygenase family)